jgi:hypothetical protein
VPLASIPSPATAGLFWFPVAEAALMAKEEVIEMNGVVAEVLADARYRVELDNGHNLVAYATSEEPERSRLQ